MPRWHMQCPCTGVCITYNALYALLIGWGEWVIPTCTQRGDCRNVPIERAVLALESPTPVKPTWEGDYTLRKMKVSTEVHFTL